MLRTLTVLFLLTGCLSVFGQSTYQGLTPGRSTKADVERALGQSVREMSPTFGEYRAPAGSGADKVFVQYAGEGTGAGIARVEVLCDLHDGDPGDCFKLFQRFFAKAKPAPSTDAIIESGPNGAGLIKEATYYSAPALLVSTFLKTPAGQSVEWRVGLYSAELYESTLPQGCTGLFRGEWETNRGHLSLRYAPGGEGDTLVGSYGAKNGSLRGRWGGAARDERGHSTFDFKGEWEDETGGGTAELTLVSDGARSSFKGEWERTSGKGPKQGTWEGRCVEARGGGND